MNNVPITPATETAQALDKFGLDSPAVVASSAPPAPAAGSKPAEPSPWAHPAAGDAAPSSDYEMGELLGTGSYGEVSKAIHKPSGDTVAIKKIKGVFDAEQDARYILRELRILRLLDHPNIVKLRDVVPPSDMGAFEQLHMVFDHLPIDLQSLLHSPSFLTGEHIRWLLLDMLKALKYLHSASIVHRDLKPANTLLNLQPVMVKLCDFGLARSLSGFEQVGKDHAKEQQAAAKEFQAAADEIEAAKAASVGNGPMTHKKMTRQLTKHVITRWYRPPEVIFCDQRYTWEVDIWSLGCIFAEMLSMQKESVPNYRHRQPLFPGRSCYPFSPGPAGAKSLPQDRQDQLSVIMDVIGTMAPEDIDDVEDPHVQRYLRQLKPKVGTGLDELYPGADPAAIDLLKKMLHMNPRKRISVEKCLDHPYLATIRSHPSAGEELVAPRTIDLEFDTSDRLTIDELRQLIIQEVVEWNPHLKSTRTEAKRSRSNGSGSAMSDTPQPSPKAAKS